MKQGNVPATRPISAAPKTPAARPLTRYVHGPKAVGSFVPKLAQKAFEKFGFAAATVLTDWREIVGPELAACTAPERLRWPRPVDGEQAATDNARSNGPRSGATLTLRVDPSRALDVQYKTAQIVERINAYFGYRAVTDIRLIQAPLAAPAIKGRLASARAVDVSAGAKAAVKTMLDKARTDTIEDADLRIALERLGSAVSLANRRPA